MRTIMDYYSKLLNEKDYNPTKKEILNEITLGTIRRDIIKYDCALITSFRSELKHCIYGYRDRRKINIYDNKGRNKELKAILLVLGYGVADVKGSFIENFGEVDAIHRDEDSFFVKNINNKPDFLHDMVELGKLYCQDSIMISEQGGENIYLYGTNNSSYPGLDRIKRFKKINWGEFDEFQTKIDGRPFSVKGSYNYFEEFKNLQNNTKKLVTDIARPIIEILRK
jgi:hypothetical protein